MVLPFGFVPDWWVLLNFASNCESSDEIDTSLLEYNE
jgi:hypothetical protein